MNRLRDVCFEGSIQFVIRSFTRSFTVIHQCPSKPSIINLLAKTHKHWTFELFTLSEHVLNCRSYESRSQSTGSPSSKYDHRRESALLRNIQNIRICMGKKPTVSVTYENERISIKNSLPYLKCVLRLSCVVHGPIYDRFMMYGANLRNQPSLLLPLTQ